MLSSVIPELPGHTAVVCHDAGAANILIASLLQTGRKDWYAYMQGRAQELWKNSFPGIAPADSLNSVLDSAELLLTGTGWGDFEHDARKMASERGIYNVAVIDHWVNYTERFVREGEFVWPDEIWVTDEYAMEIATRDCPGQNIRQIPNCYLESQLRTIAGTERVATPELLYLLEPIRDNWGRELPGEFQALNYFVDRLPKLELLREPRICLRPHPAEEPDKYDGWVKDHDYLDIRVDHALSPAESIGRSTWVAGCQTAAMVLALEAGRRVYCTLPPWAPPCQLPHDGLIHLASESA